MSPYGSIKVLIHPGPLDYLYFAIFHYLDNVILSDIALCIVLTVFLK